MWTPSTPNVSPSMLSLMSGSNIWTTENYLFTEYKQVTPTPLFILNSIPFYILTCWRECTVFSLNTKVIKITSTIEAHNVWIILSQVINNIYSDTKLIYKKKMIFCLVLWERPILALKHTCENNKNVNILLQNSKNPP